MPENITVTRKYPDSNGKITFHLSNYKGNKGELSRNDETFDPVYSAAFKLDKDEEFIGDLPEVKYMTKDACIGNNEETVYGISSSREEKIIKDEFDSTKEDSDTVYNIISKGLALIANRNMFASRLNSYPKTYLVKENTSCSKKPNVRDYQRFIHLKYGYQEKSKIHYVTVSVFDFLPQLSSEILTYSVFHFNIIATHTRYNATINYLASNFMFADEIIKEDDLLKKYFQLSNEIKISRSSMDKYNLHDFLTTLDKTYTSSFKVKTAITNYIHPTNELYFAALYLVDYYSRNIESPSYLKNGTNHDILVYICNNIDKIKTVWKAAMHLGILPTHKPVNSSQCELNIPSDVLDNEKIKILDKLYKQ
jgi:hypothetical protein